MQAETTIEPTGRRSSMLARFLSVVRGDKYMAGAYPVDAPGAVAPAAARAKER
jgi:hypothetical protein